MRNNNYIFGGTDNRVPKGLDIKTFSELKVGDIFYAANLTSGDVMFGNNFTHKICKKEDYDFCGVSCLALWDKNDGMWCLPKEYENKSSVVWESPDKCIVAFSTDEDELIELISHP